MVNRQKASKTNPAPQKPGNPIKIRGRTTREHSRCQGNTQRSNVILVQEHAVATKLTLDQMKKFVREHFEDFVNPRKAAVIRKNMTDRAGNLPASMVTNR